MILSKSCMYGIRALVYVARQKEQGFVSIREISEKLNISFHFLTKIIQKLTQNNITTSFRGPNGGVELAKPAGKISIFDIVIAIEGPGMFDDCLLGLDDCGKGSMCEIHDKWGKIRTRIISLFQKNSLAKLIKK